MKFSCVKQLLCEAINNVSKAVPQKTTISALEGIKLRLAGDELELTGYDLELGIKTVLNVMRQSDEDGEIVVSARLFSEFARKMPGESIFIEICDNRMEISSDNTNCTIPVISAEEYPDMPEIEPDSSITIKQNIVKSMISQTVFCASTNENKPILTGLLFDFADGMLNVVAIDGVRLAVRSEKVDYSEKCKFVVPKKAMSEVMSIIKDDSDKDCLIYVNKKHIIFDIGGYKIVSRLLDGEFHNYRNSLTDEFKTEVIMNIRDLLGSMERCTLLVNEKNRVPATCLFEGGEVRINCKSPLGEVKDILRADISGESVKIGMNSRFVFEALRAADGDKVRIHLSGSMRVMKILPLEGKDFVYLIMPIQLR